MPTYDYRCNACGHAWELFQSIKAEPEKKCPSCGKKKAQRVISPGAGVIFRGGGFYQTDYRSDSYTKAAAADAKPAGDGAKGDGAKSDSASESKGDSKPATPAASEAKASSKSDGKKAK